MQLQDIELHDALIEHLSVSYIDKSVTIQIGYYEDPVRSAKRVQATILFEGVAHMSNVADLLDIENNRFAGNINHWQPAEGQGTTYIYLVNGVISITAKSVRFETKGVGDN